MIFRLFRRYTAARCEHCHWRRWKLDTPTGRLCHECVLTEYITIAERG